MTKRDEQGQQRDNEKKKVTHSREHSESAGRAEKDKNLGQFQRYAG